MSKNSFRRKKKARNVGRLVIVVCEGKTEQQYFEAIRKSMRLTTLQIDVVNPNATDPLTIVKIANQIRNNKREDGNWEKKDKVYVVFDGDEHRRVNPQNWNNAIQLADSRKIELALSNPSFELWFLLHFVNQTANIERDVALKNLKKHVPNYEKGTVLYPTPLQPLLAEAISRAKKLETRNANNGLPRFNNPCTKVYELVEDLISLSKEK